MGIFSRTCADLVFKVCCSSSQECMQIMNDETWWSALLLFIFSLQQSLGNPWFYLMVYRSISVETLKLCLCKKLV